jgi:hypothetical protein
MEVMEDLMGHLDLKVTKNRAAKIRERAVLPGNS